MNKKEKYAGIIAGLSLIVMAIAAGYSYGYAQNQLLGETAELTMQNLSENKNVFFTGLVGWVIIFIADLIVALALYQFFRNTSKNVSLGTAIIRIIYTLILGIAIFQLFAIIPIITTQESASKIESLFENFEGIWSAGLIVFGLHLIGLGFLSLKSKYIPQFVGYLLLFAGASYSLIHGTRQMEILSEGIIMKIELILGLPMALGEILLAIWLIYLGFKNN